MNKRLADLQRHLPQLARPSVSLIQGGRQDFPTDPIADAYRSRIVKAQAEREGRKLVRRRKAVA